ncbi:ATP-binding protein [Acetobacter fallax]|uniref:histidine kinase n=1 Tax=Acetobacter fallax TaxID=1737473 RepID=A0ABX0KI20_9PROT|nr:ATP-binding protein [Acetobacter fallax]NHO33557.1 response regulator [Acetobacter fallax]NHO36526.1 response regulator [Acetobacter fallax]
MKDLAPRLLLVENAVTQSLSVGRLLESCGFVVEVARSAELALENLDSWLPAVVVTDLDLPGMTGEQMARQLRLNLTTRALPIIMLTDGHQPDMERQALLAGIDACIPRSADARFLVFRIHALLRGSFAPRAVMKEPFRRPTIAVATGAGGVLMSWLPADAGETGRSEATPPVVTLLRGEGMKVLPLDGPDLASPELWLCTVDCAIIDLTCPLFDGLSLCAMLDARRADTSVSGEAPLRLLAFTDAAECRDGSAATAYAAGADDIVDSSIGAEFLLLRVRALLRRKALLEETRRSEVERLAREAAMEGARAKTVLAEALEQANDELASTNRKLIDAQTRLVQSAKMASLGELVAGIAHEFNNPLAFVLAHEDTVSRTLERALMALDAGQVTEAHAMLEKSRDRLGASSIGLGRMRDLVSSLRRFSRLDQGAFDDVNMPEAINTVLALLTPKLEDKISVSCNFQAPPVLRCQMALVHQVVMNVISNAADAFTIPEEGRAGDPFHIRQRDPGPPQIRITTAVEPPDLSHPDNTAGYYVITISDNGPGVPPLMRERVFEPFFTTKPVGEGTGLGLATAYGVVKAHHGTIDVTESPEGGACFTISVPLLPHPFPARDTTDSHPTEAHHEHV